MATSIPEIWDVILLTIAAPAASSPAEFIRFPDANLSVALVPASSTFCKW
jgi:hypothetical protein